MDTNYEPNHEVPKWSETRWQGCWNPDQGVGIYTHMGRFRKELDLWWVQTVAYLPDGKLAVDRSWARQPDNTAIRTGNFESVQSERGFTSRFDGVGELTTTEALATGVRGASAPSVPVRWEFETEPSAPVWDLTGGGDELQQASDNHGQGAVTTKGSLTVDGETYSLDGIGYWDHSCGVRAFVDYTGHNFVVMHMPGWTAHAIKMLEGGNEHVIGVFFRDGEEDRLEAFDMPMASDAFGGPNEHELILKPASGEEMRFGVEVLHQFQVTVTDDGDNINGIDWEAGPPPVVLYMEAAARFTGPDGEVGYGYHERGVMRDSLERPSASKAAQASGVA
jgi:hypothetical protein